jgi:hypothetical protein
MKRILGFSWLCVASVTGSAAAERPKAALNNKLPKLILTYDAGFEDRSGHAGRTSS